MGMILLQRGFENLATRCMHLTGEHGDACTCAVAHSAVDRHATVTRSHSGDKELSPSNCLRPCACSSCKSSPAVVPPGPEAWWCVLLRLASRALEFVSVNWPRVRLR